MDKVALSKADLNENVEAVNEFLTEKGMSEIQGGNVQPEWDWGNSNYSESTRPIKR